jgi:uncharacterized membrane protein YhaH (DUF805 family)
MDNGLKYSVAIVFVVAFFALIAVMAMAFHDHKDTWLNFAAKIIAMFVISIAVLLTLTGCSVHYPQVANPRSLQWGIGQPHCLFLCFATATATDAESGAQQTNAVTTTQSADVSVGVTP